jgi:hypothetical protein
LLTLFFFVLPAGERSGELLRLFICTSKASKVREPAGERSGELLRLFICTSKASKVREPAGERSGEVARFLRALGFAQVASVEGRA